MWDRPLQRLKDEHVEDVLICHGNVCCCKLEVGEVLQTCFRLGRDRRNKKSIWHQNKTILVTAISLILNEAIVGYVCFAFIISRQNRWQRRHLKPHVRQNNPGCQRHFFTRNAEYFPLFFLLKRIPKKWGQQMFTSSRGFTAKRNPLCFGVCWLLSEWGRKG